VGSFHAACLTASNSTRRKQITEAHDILKTIGKNNPTIMVGDYNYPVFKRGLRVCIEKSGYKLNFSDRPTYVIAKLLRAHLDLTTSFNARIDQVKTLPKGISDHKPILIQTSL
jgi:endonuclease/exonuclease/phosphatase (EEP) superfamily protein YafD